MTGGIGLSKSIHLFLRTTLERKGNIVYNIDVLLPFRQLCYVEKRCIFRRIGPLLPYFFASSSYKLQIPLRRTSERLQFKISRQYWIFCIVSLSTLVLISNSKGFSGWGPGFLRSCKKSPPNSGRKFIILSCALRYQTKYGNFVDFSVFVPTTGKGMRSCQQISVWACWFSFLSILFAAALETYFPSLSHRPRAFSF